jgi:glutathione S-transferase
MILYFSPGACSLADHIALHEAHLAFDPVKVDLKTHITEDGRDFGDINPKGYVPALLLPSGDLLTENVAILSWIADQAPSLAPQGDLGRYRLLEVLAYISTEIHKGFKPFFSPGSADADKAQAGATITKRLRLLAGMVQSGFLFGKDVSVADAYLFVMLTWAERNAIEVPDALAAFAERMRARPAVQLALKHEGIGDDPSPRVRRAGSPGNQGDVSQDKIESTVEDDTDPDASWTEQLEEAGKSQAHGEK